MGERGSLVFALCYFKTHIGVAVQNYTFNSSVLRGAPGRGGKEEREGKRRGDRDFFVVRFPSYSQGRCVSICSACNTLHDRLWCRGMALRARACPLVKIAHLFSWRLGSNVEQWSMAGCGFPERDFAHICSDGARAYPSCAMSFLAGYEALVWRYARAHAPWSK